MLTIDSTDNISSIYLLIFFVYVIVFIFVTILTILLKNLEFLN